MLGSALAPGSFIGAFARTDLETDQWIGRYHAHASNEISHPSDLPYSADYVLQLPRRGKRDKRVDAGHFDSCHAARIDEGNTEGEENCMFVVREDGQIWVRATRPISPGEQLLTRYGYEYWCNSRWPASLLRAMFVKYSPTLSKQPEVLKHWSNIIRRKEMVEQAAQHQYPGSPCIKKHPDDGPSPTIPTATRTRHYAPSLLPLRNAGRCAPNTSPTTSTATSHTAALRQARRRQAKKTRRRDRQARERQATVTTHNTVPESLAESPHSNTVSPTQDPQTYAAVLQRGLDSIAQPNTTPIVEYVPQTPPLAPPPTLPLLAPEEETIQPLLPENWTKRIIPDVAGSASLTAMFWSCRAQLYTSGNLITSQARSFLGRVAHLIEAHDVDIMFLNDAHCTKGSMAQLLPLIYTLLPDCRVYQFPTTVIQSHSYNPSNDRMGGAIAIVSHHWRGYTSQTSTDPMGIGIINSLDLTRGPYRFRVINLYLPPDTHSEGAGTIHARVRRYLDKATLPTSTKKQNPRDFLLDLTQKWITQARAKNVTTIVGGDFNIPLSGRPTSRKLKAWLHQNNLTAPLADTLHRIPEYHTWWRGETETTIDHIMHTPLPPNVLITEHGTINDVTTNHLSDHHPLWVRLCLTDPLIPVPKRRPIPASIRMDLEIRDKEEKLKYQECISRLAKTLPKTFRKEEPDGTTMLHPDHSSRAVAALLRLSVRAVTSREGLGKGKKGRLKQRCLGRGSTFKDGFSPEMRLLGCYRDFYQQLIRKAFPVKNTARSQRWTLANYQSVLTTWLGEWSAENNTLLKQIRPTSRIHKIASPAHLQFLPFWRITAHSLHTIIDSIKDQLHGAKRVILRAEMSQAIARRDKLRADKRIGDLIEEMSGHPRSQMDLHTLPCAIRGQIVDHFEIHQTLTDYFTEWYSSPSNLDPAARHISQHPDFWDTLLERDPKQARPHRLHPDSAIPPELQDGLRSACASKVTDDFRQRLDDVIRAPVTRTEFNDTLDGITNGGAPGPSDATANMVKAWPPDVRDLVFMHMTNIWSHLASPTWFKDKVMKLAPKIPGNSDLLNIRPISLYEVIRKVWTTIISKRINLTWHNEGILHGGQYGYQLDNGTPMPLLNVANEIEDAIHNQRPKQATFWDIRRAFDSIPRNLQRLAWTRLGVPHDIAEWFVSLDDQGLSFIGSPHFAACRNLRTPEQLYDNDEHMSQRPDLAFQAERGIGQGESASSLLWVALYDILLEWIDPRNSELHTAEGMSDKFSAEDIAQTIINAYADDLATITGGPRAEQMQQQQATWLSAFCAFTGLTMHPRKIQATTLGPPPLNQPRLSFFDQDWTEIQCQVNTEIPAIRYLGVDLDLRHDGTEQFDAVLLDLECRLSHLLLEAGSPQTKLEFIRNKILPIARYTAIVANWSLAQYRKLDRPLSSAYRKILALPTTMPTALLYLPAKYCGIGLARLSDQAQVQKWENFQRCLAVGGAPGQATQCLLDRVPQEPTPLNSTIRTIQATTWTRGRRYTARSIVEWMGESNLSLAARKADTENDIASRHRNVAALRDATDIFRYCPYSPSDPLVPATRTELEDMAKQLELWPAPDWFGSQQDMPTFSSFFTDGSYSPRHAVMADILTPEAELRDQGRGAGAIVFFPTHQAGLPQRDPISIRILSPHSEPGMNAYTWELVTQLVALTLAKHLPPQVNGYSDCKSAISRTNRALRTKNDQLATTTAGVYGAATHALADMTHPRTFKWVKSHPETDPTRADLSVHEDLGIFMADAVAVGDHRSLRARHLAEEWTTLNFENILNEIIPINQWHARTTKGTKGPILDDLLRHQHDAQLKTYLLERDNNRAANSSRSANHWSATSLAFTAKVHPPTSTSSWALARRTLMVFDWLGHGRNRAKMKTTLAEKTRERKCPHCHQPDSQGHCMLACRNPRFTEIRTEARITQSKIATALMEKNGPHQKHFIQQLCTASWEMNSPHVERIWLGTWRPEMLPGLIATPTTARLGATTRHQYISLARQLTAPLLKAYRAIVDINVTQRDRAQGYRDYQPPEHDEEEAAPPTTDDLTYHDHLHLAALHPQRASSTNAPLPLTSDRISNTTGYSLSDSTFRSAEAFDGG